LGLISEDDEGMMLIDNPCIRPAISSKWTQKSIGSGVILSGKLTVQWKIHTLLVAIGSMGLVYLPTLG